MLFYVLIVSSQEVLVFSCFKSIAFENLDIIEIYKYV